MSRLQPVWLLLCIGVSAGTNHLTKPHVAYELSVGERSMGTGTLWLEDAGERHEFKIVTMQVVAAEVPRLLADTITVRELWLRSPEEEIGASPDLELFVDWSAADGHVIDAHARDAGLLTSRDLPVLAAGVGGEARSHVRLPGFSNAAPVSAGTLRITRALDLAKNETEATYRVEGDLTLLLHDEAGDRTVRGGLSARLRWQ